MLVEPFLHFGAAVILAFQLPVPVPVTCFVGAVFAPCQLVDKVFAAGEGILDLVAFAGA